MVKLSDTERTGHGYVAYYDPTRRTWQVYWHGVLKKARHNLRRARTMLCAREPMSRAGLKRNIARDARPFNIYEKVKRRLRTAKGN
jgi:trans-2-enoyl-CoA reductase